MSDYISREAAYKTLTEYYHQRTDIQHRALREALNRIPAADVVEVVRCRDCAYRHFSYCSAQIHPFPIHLDNYCSFGRKHLACSTSTGTTEGEVKQ